MSDTDTNTNPFNESDNAAPESSLPSFPLVQFTAGRPDREGARAMGGFFISEEEGIVPTGKHWVKFALLPKSGEPVPGYLCTSVGITVIRHRHAWTVKDKAGKRYRYAWGNYELAKRIGNPRGSAHVVCMLDGIDVPVCLTLSGTQSSDFYDRNGWHGLGRRNVFDPIADICKVPRQASLYFRTIVGVSVDIKGKPIYRTVGEGDNQQRITTIALYEPNAKVTTANYRTYLLSRAQAENNLSVYRDTEEWAGSWDTDKSTEVNGDGRYEEEAPF